MQRPLYLCLAIFLFAAAPLSAQAADSSFLAFLDSLPSNTPDQLAALQADDVDDLRQGFALLETHRRTKNLVHASKAARLFAARVRENQHDAWARFGIAVTLLRAPKTMALVRAAGVADGQAKSVWRRQLDIALQTEPQIADAANTFAMFDPDKASPNAIVAIDTAAVLAREPVTSLDYLNRSNLLFAQRRDTEGAAAYFSGVALWDSATAQKYADEAATIATYQEMITLTDGSLEKRADKLRTFWKKRSVRDGVSIAERLGEHYRRIAYARRTYSMANRGQDPISRRADGKLRTGVEKDVDDRGLIYIRFGEPNDMLGDRMSHHDDLSSGDKAVQAWAYRQPDGTFDVFYFVGGRIESDPMRTFAGRTGAYERIERLAGLEKYEPRYYFLQTRLNMMQTVQKSMRSALDKQTALADMAEDLAQANQRIADRNFEVLFEGMEKDAAPPKFARPLIVFHDLATFRGKGCTDIVYSVASPTPKYRLNIAVADTFMWEAETIDTMVSAELKPGDYTRASGTLCSIPDHNAYVRVTVSTDDQTGVTSGGDLTVPNYAGSELMLSDLLFATTEDGPFVRGRARLALVPPRQFKQGESFRLFYELYNLPAGRTYRTEITFTTVESNLVLKLFKGKKSTTVTFEETSTTDDLVQEIRTLVPEIESGRVDVTIKVTDLTTMQTATKKEAMWITEKD